jgi:hypothetical protein
VSTKSVMGISATRRRRNRSWAEAKRLEKGRFILPSPTDGVVALSSAQLAEIRLRFTARFTTVGKLWPDFPDPG